MNLVRLISSLVTMIVLKISIIKVPLKELLFDKEDHFDFELIDDMGETHTIPLHRIREVYRDGKLIWHREAVNRE